MFHKEPTHNESGRECSLCGQFKTWEEFHVDKKGFKGRRASCRICKQKCDNMRRFIKTNPIYVHDCATGETSTITNPDELMSDLKEMVYWLEETVKMAREGEKFHRDMKRYELVQNLYFGFLVAMWVLLCVYIGYAITVLI